MTIQVFLIQAHQDIDQLNVLVEMLRDEAFVVYVNLDRKWAVDPARVHPYACQVTRRVDVHWGSFSQVRAALNALAQIEAEVPAFDKVTFLSAQDVPLLSNARLKRALASLSGHELLDAVPIGTGPGQWAAAHRYQYFCADEGPFARYLACGLGNRVLRAVGRTRRLPGGMRPYGGSSWWSLSQACVRHVLARIAREPELVRFFRYCACPDELFFQTIVMNSPFARRVLGHNFRYVQWPRDGARSPAILVDADFARIAASGAHFCRKLDSRLSATLLSRLQALRAV